MPKIRPVSGPLSGPPTRKMMRESTSARKNTRSGRCFRWKEKFRVAFVGLSAGVRGHSSFLVHGPGGILVVVLAYLLEAEPWQWAVLLICITSVLVAEFFNSAIETLVRRVHPDRDPEIGQALDIAAAAVLVASLGALVVGAMVLLPLLLTKLD